MADAADLVCPHCQQVIGNTHTLVSRWYRQQLKARGLCWDCRLAVEAERRGRVRCAICQAKQNAAAHRRRSGAEIAAGPSAAALVK